MTDKAYIVANKKQELDVLKKLEKDGFNWPSGLNPTNFFPSNSHPFPIVLFERDCITWDFLDSIKNEEIVFDGRKEEKMYKVTQEFMNELIKWRDNEHIKPTSDGVNSYVSRTDLKNLPDIIHNWWVWRSNNPLENNNRLIAIVQWLNGEDVFEVEEPHKFVVRSDKEDREGDCAYVSVENGLTTASYFFDSATKFDTREEAQEWANSHQVVVEIDEEGNEVE